MKRRVLLLILLAINYLSFSQHKTLNPSTMNSQTEPIKLQMPSIVGPNLYELYTDARLYITRVYVNGIERTLSNAEGYGMTMKNGHSFSGPTGYQNKVILNSHMRKGDNEIQVVFEPSPIITEVIKEGAQDLFKKDMFVRAVIVRGELKENSLGVSTNSLDELLAKEHPEVEVLENEFVKDIAEERMNEPIIMTFTINVPKNELDYRGQIHSCEVGIGSSNNFTANLLLNGIVILQIKDNTRTTIEPLYKIIEGLDNTIELQVLSINDNAKESYLEYYVDCDMAKMIKRVGLQEKHPSIHFGDFFNRLQLPLWHLKFDKIGTYKSTFKFYY